MSEFDLKRGDARALDADQLLELTLWHHGYGLQVGFAYTEGAVTLDGDAGALFTEVLRLATLGLKTRAQARDVAGVCQQLVVEADTEWNRRFRG